MQVRPTADEGLQILEIEGDVDLASSPELREILHDLAREKPSALALDFSRVSYIDSSGLATIVEYVRKAQSYDGKLAVIGANERVRTVFELVRLDEFLPLHPSLADARAAWASVQPPA
jgi:anti-sigma B factor antagonist